MNIVRYLRLTSTIWEGTLKVLFAQSGYLFCDNKLCVEFKAPIIIERLRLSKEVDFSTGDGRRCKL